MPQLIGALLILGLIIGIIYAYVVGIGLFFVYVAPVLFVAGSLLFSGVVLWHYVQAMGANLFWGTGWVDSPDTGEPAFRQYFFRKAFRDYEAIVHQSYAMNVRRAEAVIASGKILFTNPGKLFTWPLGVVFYCIVAGTAAVAAVVYLAFGAIHLLLVGLFCAIAMTGALAFRFLEYISMLWRRIFLACHNAGCYQKISLPIYMCPDCGAEHKRLIPGPYGTFRRRCQCGQKLPTLFLFGRNRLPAVCPHESCRRPLSAALGTLPNLHVPVVGGPAAGKTSFLMANMVELSAQTTSGKLSLKFPEKKDERLFESCRAAFAAGTVVGKTAEYSPDAFLVRLGDSRGKNALLYVYDAAGELYQQRDVLQSHQYYSYTHGILFLVDPFSLPQVRTDNESSLTQIASQVRPSEELPQDVYDRMISTLREFSKMGKIFRKQPMAVVVTKSDTLDLAHQMDGASSANGTESATVRHWLTAQGEANLVRSIEHDFKVVRFFHCSALGRLPDNTTRPFTPDGVLRPLQWVLGHYGLTVVE